MNPKILPIVGIITNTEKDFYGTVTDLHGKNVLLIGFSEGEADEYVAKYTPLSIKMLTKWDGHVDADVNKYPLYVGDICTRTDFNEDAFDAVLTLSVLEHLDNLSGAVEEMWRITKNGGCQIHMFGPAWSSAYGHHVYAKADDDLLNFSLWKMPAHMHLLCTAEEIISYYIESGRTESEGRNAVHWFFDAPIINRLFFIDYMKVFSGARIQLDWQQLMYNKLPENHLQVLREKYPKIVDFSTYGAKMKFIVNK